MTMNKTMDWKRLIADLIAYLPPSTRDTRKASKEIIRAVGAVAIGEAVMVDHPDGMAEIAVMPGWSLHFRKSHYEINEEAA